MSKWSKLLVVLIFVIIVSACRTTRSFVAQEQPKSNVGVVSTAKVRLLDLSQWNTYIVGIENENGKQLLKPTGPFKLKPSVDTVKLPSGKYKLGLKCNRVNFGYTVCRALL